MTNPGAAQCHYCGNAIDHAPPMQQQGYGPPPGYGPPQGYGQPPPGYAVQSFASPQYVQKQSGWATFMSAMGILNWIRLGIVVIVLFFVMLGACVNAITH